MNVDERQLGKRVHQRRQKTRLVLIDEDNAEGHFRLSSERVEQAVQLLGASLRADYQCQQHIERPFLNLTHGVRQRPTPRGGRGLPWKRALQGARDEPQNGGGLDAEKTVADQHRE